MEVGTGKFFTTVVRKSLSVSTFFILVSLQIKFPSSAVLILFVQIFKTKIRKIQQRELKMWRVPPQCQSELLQFLGEPPRLQGEALYMTHLGEALWLQGETLQLCGVILLLQRALTTPEWAFTTVEGAFTLEWAFTSLEWAFTTLEWVFTTLEWAFIT